MDPYKLKDLEKGLFKTGMKEETYNECWPEWVKENGDTRNDYIWYCYNLLLDTWAKQSTSLEIMYPLPSNRL